MFRNNKTVFAIGKSVHVLFVMTHWKKEIPDLSVGIRNCYMKQKFNIEKIALRQHQVIDDGSGKNEKKIFV